MASRFRVTPKQKPCWGGWLQTWKLYVIESGVLRAVYRLAGPDAPPDTEESMVAGTLAGELSALSESARNATGVVERHAVVWKLSVASLRRMETEQAEMARTLVMLILKGECFCV